MTPKLRRFPDEVRPATPCLVLDVDVVELNYLALARAPHLRPEEGPIGAGADVERAASPGGG